MPSFQETLPPPGYYWLRCDDLSRRDAGWAIVEIDSIGYVWALGSDVPVEPQSRWEWGARLERPASGASASIWDRDATEALR